MISERKRQKMLQDVTGQDAVAVRQREWLQRTSTTKTTAFRPVELYRLGAKHWMMQLDSQIRAGTCWSGLKDLIPANFKAEWALWKGAGLGIDLGGDGLSGAMALIYKWKCNIFLWPDENHLDKSAFQEMLKDAGKMDLDSANDRDEP